MKKIGQKTRQEDGKKTKQLKTDVFSVIYKMTTLLGFNPRLQPQSVDMTISPRYERLNHGVNTNMYLSHRRISDDDD